MYTIIGGLKKSDDSKFSFSVFDFITLVKTDVGCEEKIVFEVASSLCDELAKGNFEGSENAPPGHNPTVIITNNDGELVGSYQKNMGN